MPHNKRKNKNKGKNRVPKSQQQHTPAHEQRAADPVELLAQVEAEKQQQQHVEQTSVVSEPEHEEKALDVQEPGMTPVQQDEAQSLIDADNQLDQLEAQEPMTPVKVPVTDDTSMTNASQEPSLPAETPGMTDLPMADESNERAKAPAQANEPASDEPMQESENTPTADHPDDEHHEQRQQELAKLHAIESKVQQIHDKLATRLPLQRRHLAARVCGAIWLARTRLAKLARENDSDMESATTMTSSDASAQQQQQLYSQLAKKLRMELGAFDYQSKEQGELLTRLLCELDDILSFGDAEIKRARKALVVAIQSDALPLADAMRDQSARLKAFGEALLAGLLAVLPQHNTEAPADAASAETLSSSPRASATISTSDTVNDVEMRPLDDGSSESAVCEDGVNDADGDDERGSEDSDGSEDEDMAAADDSDAELQDNEADNDGEDSDCDGCSDDSDDEVCEEEQDDVTDSVMREQTAARSSQTTPTHSPRSCSGLLGTNTADVVQTLPVWRPYYQLQKRRDGLYLVANLRDVEPANVHVQWLESVGVLRISGYKLPTQKDLAVTRFSGVPTFGRFEIAERLPANALAMDSATQALRADGTLEVRMPFDVAPRWQRQRLQPSLSPLPSLQRWQFHPSVFDGRRSLFDAPRCVVW